MDEMLIQRWHYRSINNTNWA